MPSIASTLELTLPWLLLDVNGKNVRDSVSSLASPSYSYEPDDDDVVVVVVGEITTSALVFSRAGLSTAPELPEFETSFRSISI